MTVTSISTGNGSIQSAIARASQATGIDFDYLLGQAQVESGLHANARAGTSSATGLYQFIDQSWLGVVKKHGAEYGLGWAADSIGKTASGKFTVSDAGTRQAILALRNDPAISSLMAAEHASDNKDAIEASTGRGATGTDLYMAHFLGLGGARSFLANMTANPDRSGASLFPAAARANRNIFYDASGSARSLSDIYSRFAAKLDRGASAAGATGLASDALDSFQAQPGAAEIQLASATVVPGNGDTEASATTWAQATLDRLNGTSTRTAQVNLLRPTPNTARLAYMMLASLGA
ncbi:hypothetical protein BH09PSE4_BH09PSE4_20160 [soil metagenome]